MNRLRTCVVGVALLTGAWAFAQEEVSERTSLDPEISGNFGYSTAFLERGDTTVIVVGAPDEDSTNGLVLNAGRVHVQAYVPENFAALPIAIDSPSPGPTGSFGYTVVDLGDVDDDGANEFLVGEPGFSGGAAGIGRAHVFFGSDFSFHFTIDSPDPTLGGRFGQAAARIPDVNGDGIDDVAISAIGEGVGADRRGRVHIFTPVNGTLLRTLESPAPVASGQFGNALAGVRDTGGDGKGDVLIGAANENGTAGKAYLMDGGTGALIHEFFSPEATNNQSDVFGYSVSAAPDFTGDGIEDLIVSAPHETGDVPGSGQVHVFDGKTGEPIAAIVSPNGQTDGVFGGTVRGIPDATGDGLGDFLVAATFEDGGGATESGRVYFFNGGGLFSPFDFTSGNAKTQGEFGAGLDGRVSLVGRETKLSVLVGAPNEDDVAERAGRAYIHSVITISNMIGSIQGLVEDEGGNPVGSATVRLEGGAFIDDQITTTNSRGEFRYDNVEIESYFVDVFAPGFTQVGGALHILPEDFALDTGIAVVEIEMEEFDADPTITVSGRVIELQTIGGSDVAIGLASVRVAALLNGSPFFPPRETFTNGRGFYELSGLPVAQTKGGDVTLEFTAPDYAEQEQARPGVGEDLNPMLEKRAIVPFIVQGVVTEEEAPVEGAEVDIINPDGTLGFNLESNEDGLFAVNVPVVGQYTVTASTEALGSKSQDGQITEDRPIGVINIEFVEGDGGDGGGSGCFGAAEAGGGVAWGADVVVVALVLGWLATRRRRVA